MAVRTGFEPATPGVTGRYSNQLNYRTTDFLIFEKKASRIEQEACGIGSLAVTDSRMGRPHTTIGATVFHC